MNKSSVRVYDSSGMLFSLATITCLKVLFVTQGGFICMLLVCFGWLVGPWLFTIAKP